MRSTDLAANDAADDTCIRSRLTNQYATNHATGSVHAHTTCAHACNRDTPDRHPHTCTSRVASSTTLPPTVVRVALLVCRRHYDRTYPQTLHMLSMSGDSSAERWQSMPGPEVRSHPGAARSGVWLA